MKFKRISKQAGLIREIAELIGMNRSTISREVKRNSGLKCYRFRQAREKALSRHRTVGKMIRFTAEIKAEMSEWLGEDRNLAPVSSSLKVEGGRSSVTRLLTASLFTIKGGAPTSTDISGSAGKNAANIRTAADKF